MLSIQPNVHQDPMVLVPRPDTWTVLVHGKYIDEISRAPEDQLSFVVAASNVGCMVRNTRRCPDRPVSDIPNSLQFRALGN
jgi:hypothetical protein